MPDWFAPFHGPKVPTLEFLKRRDEYVKKNGYRYSVPGFDGMVHLGFEKDISHEEEKIWKRKKYSELAPGRFEQIKYMKNERKLRYLDMLGSPQPQIFQNRGTLLGSIDDCQDAISTVCALGRILLQALPSVVSKALMGPLTWLMAANEVLNMSTQFLAPEQRLVAQKRMHDKVTEDNPFSKKARLKNEWKIKNAGFGFSDLLQAGQVTKDIFGIGISMGAIMNLPLDILTGAARAAMGQKVTVSYPVPDLDIWWERLLSAGKTMLCSMGMPPNPEFKSYAQHLILHNLLGQLLTPENIGFDPLVHVQNAAHVEILAPSPTHFLTREVIQEIDPEGFDAIGWPSTGQKWSTINDLAITAAPQITQNFQDFCYNNRRDMTAYVAAKCATQGTFHAIENAAGKGSMEYDYTASCKTCHSLLDQNLRFPLDLKPWQRARMLTWLEAHDAENTVPALPEVIAFAWSVCGFKFGVGMLGSGVQYDPLGIKKAQPYIGIFDQPKTPEYPTVPKAFSDAWKKLKLSAENQPG